MKRITAARRLAAEAIVIAARAVFVEADADIVAKKPQKPLPDKASAGPAGAKQDRLEEYLKFMDAEGLDELEVRHGHFEIKLVRQAAATVVHTAPAAAPRPAAAKKPEVEEIKGTPVKSPLAGVFYRSPSPAAAPFVKEGDTVTAEKTLCLVEAMKVMNEITAGVHGKVTRIMVENGKSVSSGQVLFVIEPS